MRKFLVFSIASLFLFSLCIFPAFAVSSPSVSCHIDPLSSAPISSKNGFFECILSSSSFTVDTPGFYLAQLSSIPDILIDSSFGSQVHESSRGYSLFSLNPFLYGSISSIQWFGSSSGNVFGFYIPDALVGSPLTLRCSKTWVPNDTSLQSVTCSYPGLDVTFSLVSSSDVPSSSTPVYPDRTVTRYVPGPSTQADVSLSRQQFVYGFDTSTGVVMTDISDDYFQYPNVATGVLGPLYSGAAVSGRPILGTGQSCYIRQYFEVPLSEGLHQLSFSVPSPPVLTYSGKVVSYASSYPGVQGGLVSGTFSSGSTSSPVISSNVQVTSQGYYSVSGSGRYTFYIDFPYTASWPPYIVTGSLSATAPALPVVTDTPISVVTETIPGTPVPSPTVPSIPDDSTSSDDTQATLDFMAQLYQQYLLDSTVSSCSPYFVSEGPDGLLHLYELFPGLLNNRNPAEAVWALQMTECSISEFELNLLSDLASNNFSLSELRTQLNGSLSPLVSIVQSAAEEVVKFRSDFADYIAQEGLNLARIELGVNNMSSQLHQDLLNILSALSSSSGSSDRPLSQFEDTYVNNFSSQVSNVEDKLSVFGFDDELNDLFDGVSTGDWGDSSLAYIVTLFGSDSSAFDLWSDETNDAFAGNVDSWYNDFESRRSSW